MARKPDIQYIRFYTDGSAARQLDIAPPRKKKSRLPKPKTRKPKVFRIDPLAVGGIVVSVIMLALMIVGSVQLFDLQGQAARMENYITDLSQQNTTLTQTYESGYDLEEIETIALSMGMIPIEQAPTLTISVQQPEVEQRITAWESFCTFLVGIFA